MDTLSLKDATEALDAACVAKLTTAAEVDSARRRDCDATNALNAAQKAFDEAVAAIHKQAPRDSNWYSAHVQKRNSAAL